MGGACHSMGGAGHSMGGADRSMGGADHALLMLEWVVLTVPRAQYDLSTRLYWTNASCNYVYIFAACRGG